MSSVVIGFAESFEIAFARGGDNAATAFRKILRNFSASGKPVSTTCVKLASSLCTRSSMSCQE
jgi:putative intracellular protease/amidase